MEWQATIDDLCHVPENGKAELVDGKLVRFPPYGWRVGRACGEIIFALHAYEQQMDNGFTFTGTAAFIVDLPRRRSFCPDAAYCLGELAGALNEFVTGAPTLAVEVRSPRDYGPAAERKMARKRAEYFAAGTLVVWDVDVLREMVVRVYRAGDPEKATMYGKGEFAEAEPAVPGWRFEVERILPKPRG